MATVSGDASSPLPCGAVFCAMLYPDIADTSGRQGTELFCSIAFRVFGRYCYANVPEFFGFGIHAIWACRCECTVFLD